MSELHDEQPAPEPEPSEPEPSEPEPQAPDFSQFAETPEFQQAVQRTAEGWLQSELARASEQSDEPALDFLAEPDEVKASLQKMIQSEIQAAIAPMLPAVEQMEVAVFQDKIEQSLGQIPTVKEIDQMLPENTPDDQRAPVMVERMATAFLPEMRQLYGDSDRALEASLRAAADYILPVVKAAHGSGYSARGAELQRLSGAPQPTPTSGGEAQVLDEPLNELEAAERFAARHGLR